MSQVDYGSDREARLQREAVQQRWRGAYGPARHIDPLLLLAALGLTAIGVVMIYSATYHRLDAQGTDTMYFVNRQVIALVLGVVAMGAVMLFDYRLYRVWAPLLYAVSLVMLVITAATGTTVNASRAWIVFGGFQFQPAEIAKPALILMLAALFHERRESALGLRALIEAMVIAALPMLLILAQPDLGTAIVFVAITFGVLLLARVRVRYMVALAMIGVVSLVGAYQLNILKEYQVARLTTFFNSEAADLQGAGYNVNQAQIAVGSGQLTGQGLLQGTQTSLSYVPENHTDFIFTVVAEEFGFVGASILLGLFALLLWRALRIAATSRDTFGMLIAAGIIAVFSFQLFINVGMSIGIMPVTGLPLPFVSYGGTSLIGSFLMIGLLQNVYMRRFT
jgi:rod shape determining protein RodA